MAVLCVKYVELSKIEQDNFKKWLSPFITKKYTSLLFAPHPCTLELCLFFFFGATIN